MEVRFKDGPAPLVLEHREGLLEAQRSKVSDLIPRPVLRAVAKFSVLEVSEILDT